MKRAQCFNQTALKKHFEEFQEMLEVIGRPVKLENLHNMDEKGAQMEGGRKSSGIKYFFSREDRARYRKHNDNLELVTIIECISASGDALTPGFIFNGPNFDMSWFDAATQGPWPRFASALVNLCIQIAYHIYLILIALARPQTGGLTTFSVFSGSRKASFLLHVSMRGQKRTNCTCC